MKLLVILTIFIFVSCERLTNVYKQDNFWICKYGMQEYQFEGTNAMELAHKRCDSFLETWQKIHREKE